MPFLQPGKVNMPATCAVEQIAFPHQGVAMQIGDEERLVQRLCLGADLLAGGRDPVHRLLGQLGHEEEEGGGCNPQQQHKASHYAAHHPLRLSVTKS